MTLNLNCVSNFPNLHPSFLSIWLASKKCGWSGRRNFIFFFNPFGAFRLSNKFIWLSINICKIGINRNKWRRRITQQLNNWIDKGGERWRTKRINLKTRCATCKMKNFRSKKWLRFERVNKNKRKCSRNLWISTNWKESRGKNSRNKKINNKIKGSKEN